MKITIKKLEYYYLESKSTKTKCSTLNSFHSEFYNFLNQLE